MKLGKSAHGSLSGQDWACWDKDDSDPYDILIKSALLLNTNARPHNTKSPLVTKALGKLSELWY